MGKSHSISIRVSSNQYDFVKKMDGSFSQIFQIGFDKWSAEFPDFLKKKIKEYKTMYTQCIDKMQECNGIVYTKKKSLLSLYAEYVENGRDIKNPSIQDKSWIRSRLTRLNMGVSMEYFFDFCKKKFLDDSQRKLDTEVFDDEIV